MTRRDYEKIVKKHFSFRLKRDLELKQISNLMKYIATDIKDNDIIGFFDTSFWKSGKSGYLITKNAFYDSNHKIKIVFKGLKDITYKLQSTMTCQTTFHYVDGSTIEDTITIPNVEDLVGILREIAMQYNAKKIEPKQEKKKVEEPVFEYRQEEVGDTIVCPYCGYELHISPEMTRVYCSLCGGSMRVKLIKKEKTPEVDNKIQKAPVKSENDKAADLKYKQAQCEWKKRNYSQASDLYWEAAQLGHVESIKWIAKIHWRMRPKIVDYLIELGKKGDMDAVGLLGYIFMEYEGCTLRAVNLLQKAEMTKDDFLRNKMVQYYVGGLISFSYEGLKNLDSYMQEHSTVYMEEWKRRTKDIFKN